MPISFHGFFPAAIFLMVCCFLGKQIFDYWKHTQKTKF